MTDIVEAIADKLLEDHMALLAENARLREELATVPKPAQCNCQQGQVCPVCDPDLVPAQAEKQEPVCGHESCDCRGYCKRKQEPDGFPFGEELPDLQEPVKDEPVAFFIVEQWMHYEQASKDTPGAFPVFTRPQPDLTAEVKRLKSERDSFYMDYRMKCDLETKQQAERIAALEAEVDHLYQVCRDAYEVWAGSNGIPEPITCVEAYLLQLLIAMRDEVKRGLK